MRKISAVWALLSRLTALLTLLVIAGHPLRAHEVQPAVADLMIGADRVEISIRMTIEAPLANVDLAGLLDTNDAANSAIYDAKRALAPDVLAEEVARAWPSLARRMTLEVGGTRLTPEFDGVTVPEIGNVDLARFSTLRLSAALPPGDEPVIFGFDASMGNLILRQTGVEDGYTAYLTNGTLSDPIARSGPSGETAFGAFVDYIGVGFDHIIPKGLDHILFVLGLFFLALRMGPLLWQVSAFTLAHTVTLALGALEIVRIPPEIVEPIIAASIVYVGVENVLSRGMQPWRPVVVFCFGLLHGLGFASVLADFGLGSSHFVPKLIGFNLGVEIGQLAVIAAAWLVLGAAFARFSWYKVRLAAPVSVAIAVIATFWVFERTSVIAPEGLFGPFATLTEGGMPMSWAGVAAVAIVVLTGLALLTDAEPQDGICGFLTSFVAFCAVTGAFTSGAYWVMAGLVALWFVALRVQSLGDGGQKAVAHT